MKIIKGFILIFLFIYIQNQVPEGSVINSCGKLGYEMPKDNSECKEKNEYCCFVHLQNNKNTSQSKKFCATAPNNIRKDDIEKEIYTYTDYDLVELTCNNSQFLYFNMFFLLIFILF